MEKLELKNCWEKKYIDHTKDYTEKSLKGNITTYKDKWGAFLCSRDTFGVGDRVYYCELEYIEAISHLITIERLEKLLTNRDKTNEKAMYKNFDMQEMIKEEIIRRKQ